ncbi:class I mannose-6-phosphate isomerase [Novosphingobium sp. 17-62-19]|uniref:class I mannose-6-phosphate isomerase n=1 Tax=Novosphingobium sp. 17-62-19 TaxID=1970406 RepID=UPI0025FC5A50|nr:class I mannose-6-phosphate isomerase [Novosphingobium sp. 17-62-19]HQS95145.1 class I mannose-6-phosphate isomerase [Novosphingobium sp.]
MRLLGTKIVEKPWGKDVLPPQFDVPEGKRIGEVWFEPPPKLPDILIKYIFTREKLSVQVHPNDVQAKDLGESDRGKEECWLVINAEPGAVLGIGFKQPVDAETMRVAALNGSIEALMEWYPVQPGDFFYIPAGTVHAIGAGVSLIEIQQNSDITYRLYDYGRGRELHLDKGLQVARGELHDPALRRKVSLDRSLQLVNGPYFKVEYTVAEPAQVTTVVLDAPTLVVPVACNAVVRDQVIKPGQCAMAEAGGELRLEPPSGTCLLVQGMPA